jgi:hypothetical protein
MTLGIDICQPKRHGKEFSGTLSGVYLENVHLMNEFCEFLLAVFFAVWFYFDISPKGPARTVVSVRPSHRRVLAEPNGRAKQTPNVYSKKQHRKNYSNLITP